MRRYLILAVTVCVAMAALAFPAVRSDAEQNGEYIPVAQTLDLTNQQRLAGVGAIEYAPVLAPKPFSHILIRRDADLPIGSDLLVEVRASTDGQSWSPWSIVAANDDLVGPDDRPGVIWSQIFEVGAIASYWQVRATPIAAPDGALPSLRQLDAHTVETASGPANPIPEAAPTQRSGPELNSVSTAGVTRPGVVSRTAWGSPDGQGSRKAPAYSATTHMVVHHTADSNSLYPSEPNWAARVRAIWSYHAISRGWGDIGYNYLIDPNGVIYEGRAGGDDAVGFHDTANYGSMGVSMLGTYSSLAPTQSTQDSLVALLAWKSSQRAIDPVGSAFYYGCTISSYCRNYSPNGVVPTIAGHRQVTPNHTTCPGDATMALMPGIRERVRQLVTQGGPPPGAQLAVTGVQFERTTLAVGELLEVRLSVRNIGQTTVSGQAPQVDLNATSAFEAHVYEQDECFNSDPSGNVPLFAKENGRVRVVLGFPNWDSQHAGRCNGPTSNYPWRWGLNGDLKPNEERTIIGYVQFRTPGTYTLQAGIVQEYVGYLAQGVGATQITITPERAVPEITAYDSNLRPLVHIFQMANQPDNHLARITNPAELVRGGYVGSFAWNGEPLDWGAAGPFGLSDRFITMQVRSFNVAVAGEYTFGITADDGAWLLVDGQVVVSRPGFHPAESATAKIKLNPGIHTVAIIAFEARGNGYLAYDYRPPNAANFQRIPDLFEGQGYSNGIFVAPPLIAIGSDDFAGSGIARTRWSLNDGAWQEHSGAILQIGRLQIGSYTLRYQAIDHAGNLSAPQELRFGVASNQPPPKDLPYRTHLPIVGVP